MFEFLPSDVEILIWKAYFQATILKEIVTSSFDVFSNSRNVSTRVEVVRIRNHIHYGNTDEHSLHKYFYILTKPESRIS